MVLKVTDGHIVGNLPVPTAWPEALYMQQVICNWHGAPILIPSRTSCILLRYYLQTELYHANTAVTVVVQQSAEACTALRIMLPAFKGNQVEPRELVPGVEILA